jgi:hypothetical protein
VKCEACHKRKAFRNVYGTHLCKVCIYRLIAILEEMENKGGDLSESQIQTREGDEEHGEVSGG